MNPRTEIRFRWALTAAFAAFAAWLWTMDYARALAYLTAALDPQEKTALLAAAFTPQKYFWFRAAATAAALLPWLAPVPSFCDALDIARKIRLTWGQMPALHRAAFVVLAACWAVRNAFYISFFPITMDEANVYSTFVRRGPVLIVSYYPIPSNHVFHTLSVWVANLLPEGVWAVRLTAFLATGVTGFWIFLWVGRRSGGMGALLATGTYWFAFGPTLYGVLGRGYAFLSFFTLALFYAEATNRKTMGVAAVALGMWTAPVFVYAAAAAAAVFRRPVRMLAGLACAGVLYSPIFIAGGNLTGFYPVTTLGERLAHLPEYLPYVAEFLSPLRMPPQARWVSLGAFGLMLGGVVYAAHGRGTGDLERAGARFSLAVLALMLVPVAQAPDKAYILWTAPAAIAVSRFGRWAYAAPGVWAAASVAFVPVFRYWYAPDIAAYEKFKSLPPAKVYIADNEAEYLTYTFYAPPGASVVYQPQHP